MTGHEVCFPFRFHCIFDLDAKGHGTKHKFDPQVSATLKGELGQEICTAMQFSGILGLAALRVMRPELYQASLLAHLHLGAWAVNSERSAMADHMKKWTSVFTGASVICNRETPLHRDPHCRAQGFDLMSSFGNHSPATMNMPNLGIDLAYDAGVMTACSGRLVRHGVRSVEGDRIVWAWFVRDSVHNHVHIPRCDYARYDMDSYSQMNPCNI
jgi:hypothetical protein